MLRATSLITTLVWVCVFLYGSPSNAQHSIKPSVTTITTDDGLSQGSNYFRFEDSHGFMWITANDALNRWDGRMMKVYKSERYFKNCPPRQQGYGFAEDLNGNVYIGSPIGLYRYNRRQDNFSLIKIFNAAPDNVAMPFAFHDGRIWCYNRQFKIAAYNPVIGNSVFYTNINLEQIPSIHPYCFNNTTYLRRQPFFDKNGYLCVANSRHVCRYDMRTEQVTFPLNKLMALT